MDLKSQKSRVMSWENQEVALEQSRDIHIITKLKAKGHGEN